MSVRTGGPRVSDDPVIVAAVRAHRRTTAAAMLATAMRRHELTVGAETLALVFVDTFAAAAAERNWPAFFSWIERCCDKYAGSPPILRLLRCGIPTIAASAGSSAGAGRPGIAADFAVLAERVGSIVDRPRAVRFPVRTLDETDALLDRLMSRLTDFDAATAEHSRAVAMWCARIGKKLGLSAAETTFVTRAGLIHDIGKVTTPPEILNAPYRLSDAEMTIMRRHAAAGAEIVAAIPLLEHLTPAVRGHHERMDGRGYPDGRSGSEIPITTRIVSVADSFNAMIGNRPYRLPMAPTIALEQLKLHRGTQFDPNVVDAMIGVVHPAR